MLFIAKAPLECMYAPPWCCGLVAAGARKLTTKEFVEQPLPRLMQRVSDRASQSKTEPKHLRTFDGLELWGTFNDEVHNFRMGLDDKEARHKQLVRHCCLCVTPSALLHAAKCVGRPQDQQLSEKLPSC